ncbi:hypothetical protein CHS0354_026366 [Potamilus streckersoni]|uniref:Uncharacterized protein n=1 Tax=Potamilus streckersoni TaxID=2493646 RepID=A0AAE0T3W1_9BIVA|nr:hypothetical protein CHS0354_026366 [Potamilus streckersoni]
MHVQSPGAARKLQSCAVHKSSYHRSVRITGESQHLNHHIAMGTDPSYVQHGIAKEKVHEIHKLIEALVVFKRINIEEIKQALQLLKIMKEEQDLSEQTREISTLKKHVELMDEDAKSVKVHLREKDRLLLNLTQGTNWNVQHEQLSMRHNDLQQKYDKIQYELQAMAMYKRNLENEIETLRSKLRKTERESLQQKCDISRLNEYVKSADEESSFFKAQLQEKDMQLLTQKQGRYCNVEHEQVEVRHNVLQREFDNIKDWCQAMMMDKIKLNNEIEMLKSKLRKSKEEFLEKTNEMSRFKKHVELVVEESKSLISQLHDKEMQLLKQKQGKYWNVEQEQLEIMYNDSQRKFDKIKYESQAIMMEKSNLENENERLSIMLRKTEHELSEKAKEITRLGKRVESVKDESKSLKAQLQEKHMLLLKHNQGRNRNGEYEKLIMRHKNLQRSYDMVQYESQAMVMDKTKLETENEKLRKQLRKTEQKSSQQKSEISRL